MKIIISGPPGSGKGTRAKMISQSLGIPHISTGDLFRKEVAEDTEIGKVVKGYMERGLLVPDEMTIDLLKQRISREDCKKGFILDGFPRTLEQARMLKEIVAVDIFLDLAIRDHVIIDRMTSRRTCKNCNAIFNVKTIIPKREGICDYCSGPLVQRADEKPEVIMERLKVYEENTRPVSDFYRELGLLEELDGELTVEDENFKKQLFKKLKTNF